MGKILATDTRRHFPTRKIQNNFIILLNFIGMIILLKLKDDSELFWRK